MRNTSKEVKQLESDFNNEMNEMVRDAEVFRSNYEQKVQNAIMETTALGNAISALGQTFINQMNNVNAAAGAFQNYARSVMQAAQALATLAAVEGATGGGNGGGGSGRTYDPPKNDYGIKDASSGNYVTNGGEI